MGKVSRERDCKDEKGFVEVRRVRMEWTEGKEERSGFARMGRRKRFSLAVLFVKFHF